MNILIPEEKMLIYSDDDTLLSLILKDHKLKEYYDEKVKFELIPDGLDSFQKYFKDTYGKESNIFYREENVEDKLTCYFDIYFNRFILHNSKPIIINL